jgi:hypothetical protein
MMFLLYLSASNAKFGCVGGLISTTLEQPKTVIGAIDVRSARERAHVNCIASLWIEIDLPGSTQSFRPPFATV